MRIVFIFSLILCLFTQFDIIKINTNEPNYFSGIIEYDIEFEILDSTHQHIAYYQQAYGNKMKVTIAQNGDFIKEYFNTGAYGREYIIYKQSDNKFYGKSKSSDSLTCFHGDGVDIVTLEKEAKGQSETILNKSCQILHLSGFSEWKGISPREDLEFSYWYAEDYKINKTSHKGINDVLWQRFMEVSDGAYYLKLIMKTSGYCRIFSATKIQNQPIDSIDFEPYFKDLPILYVD